MTREDQLYAMNGATLIMLADKLGVKVHCNKTRTGLKESKDSAIAKILAAENAQKESENQQDEWEKEANAKYEKKEAEAEKAVNKKEKKEKKEKTEKQETAAPGRGAQLEFDGRSQNICTWAKELGISANTLYGRIYKLGWPVEKAFTTPSRQPNKSKA